MVLAVDDAHLLDDVSATLVHQLVAARSARVLVTMRSLESPPEPIIALWKDGLAERIQLDGLTDEAVGEALSWALDGSVDNAAVAELVARAKGNMLFLRELVTGAIAEGALCDDGGVWRLVGELHPTDRLVELVESRLRGLDEDERSLMELVSLGEPLTVPELEACADLAAVERIEQKGLVESRQDAAARLTVGLSHPVYGDVLRARMSPLRARSVARALADAVEGLGSLSDDDTLRVAGWRLMSGGAEPSLMHRAATTARWRYDFALAQRLASAAVAAGGGFDAQLLTAELLGLRGRSVDAARALAALAEQVSDAGQGARVALARLDNSVIYTGAIDEGLRIADECLATSPPPAMADEVRARRLALLVATGGPRMTVEAAEQLLRETSGRALVWACMPASYSLARAGRVDEALAVADRGYDVHRTLTEPMDWYPWMHRFYRAEALAHAGRFAEAEELSAGEYREGVRHRSLEGQALFSWQLAKSVADRGNVDAAVRRARMAAAIYRRLGRPQFVHFCLVYLAQALAVGRRHAEASEVLRSIDRLGVQTGHFMGIDLTQARGWTEAAGGDLRAAAAVFREAAEEGERIGDRVGAAAALHNLARIGRAADVVGWLDEVAVGLEGDLAGARARHARALANRSGAELDEVSQVFDDMGATLLAAEASADAAGAWSTAGERRRSAAAQRRSALLAERCAGADTPALRAVESRVHLTSAEVEAAELAAAGKSNKEIAGALCVSVRTVENRLHDIYAKLGVSGRRGLAEALSGVTRKAARPVA
jgi:DNA-binding CsgD family transcriptional regulator